MAWRHGGIGISMANNEKLAHRGYNRVYMATRLMWQRRYRIFHQHLA